MRRTGSVRRIRLPARTRTRSTPAAPHQHKRRTTTSTARPPDREVMTMTGKTLNTANRVIVVLSLVGIAAILVRALLGTKPLRAPVGPVPTVVPEVVPAAPAATQTRPAKARVSSSKGRSLVGGLTFLTLTVTISLLATSGSYALWNGKTVVDGKTLGTGSIALTVNTVTGYTLNLPTTRLTPGRSVLATATVTNAGSVPVSASVSSTDILTNTNGLAASLSLTVTPVSSAGACAAGLGGGTTGALASFTTTSAPYAMPPGAGQIVCFELRLDSAAPASVQGGATSFRLNLIAKQTRP
jgi:hypothetical protein